MKNHDPLKELRDEQEIDEIIEDSD